MSWYSWMRLSLPPEATTPPAPPCGLMNESAVTGPLCAWTSWAQQRPRHRVRWPRAVPTTHSSRRDRR